MTLRDDRPPGIGDTRGAIAVMTALLLPVLIGIAAYAIDASLLLYRQERLQIAADIGARAGAEMLVRGETEARAIAMAEAMVAANAGAPVGTVPTVTVTPPEPGRLSVEASLPVPRFFSRLFGSGDVTVRAGSVAVYERAAAPGACLYLDDPEAEPGLRLGNKSLLRLDGCSIVVASDDAKNSVELDGRAKDKILAACFDAAGGMADKDLDRIMTTTCAVPRTGVSVSVPSDFTSIPEAPQREVGCDDWDSEGGGKDDEDARGKGKGKAKDARPDPASLTPGPPLRFGLPQICLSKMTVRSDTTGKQGIYFIADKLKIEAGATLTLDPGSVIVLLKRAEIEMDAGARLVVTAPDSGPLAGMAIMQGRDRDRADLRSHELGRLEVAGWIVLSKETIEIKGQGTVSRCMRIQAGSLVLDNKRALAIACTGGGGGAGSVSLAPAL